MKKIMMKMISRVKRRSLRLFSPLLMASSLTTLILLLSTTTTTVLVTASKDSYSYYANGISNPNANDKMYWREGYNVLEDLDQFAALYVTYHSCAWEQPTFDSDDDDDNGNDDGYDNDGDDWYLGRVPAFRPNVAYSLYGILKGDKDTGCNKKTFINSFHTTRGVESFTNSMAAAGMTNLFSFRQHSGSADENNGNNNNNNNRNDPTSTCYNDEASQDGNGNAANGDDYQGRRMNGDDNNGYYFYSNQNDNNYYYNYENGAKYEPNAKSWGLGCTIGSGSSSSSSSGSESTFALQMYRGYYCDANAIYGTKKTLQDFNARLEQAVCVPVYNSADAAATSSYNNAAANNGEDGDEDEEEESGDSGDGLGDDNPLYLLATSKSCHVYSVGTGMCPDPYGKLRTYDGKLSRATGLVAGSASWWTEERVVMAGWLCIAIGALGTLMGLGLLLKHCMCPGAGLFGGSFKNTSSKTLLDDGTDGIVQMVRDQSDLASASLRSSKKMLDDGVQMVNEQGNMLRNQSKMAAVGFITAISCLAKNIKTKAAGAAERTRRRSPSPSRDKTKKKSKKKKSKKSSSSRAAAAAAAAAGAAATVAASESNTDNEDSREVDTSSSKRTMVDLDDDIQSTATGTNTLSADADDNAEAEDHLSDFECYVTEAPPQPEETEEEEDQHDEEEASEEEAQSQQPSQQQDDEQTTQTESPDYHLHEDDEDVDDFFDEEDTDNNNDDDNQGGEDDDTFDDGRDERGNQRIFQRNPPAAPRLRWLRTWRNRRSASSPM